MLREGPDGGLGGATNGNTGGAGWANGGAVFACEPSKMTGFVYPPYVAARRMQGSCTQQAIGQYYDDCITNDSCDAFMPGGAEETCGACLNPTELDAPSYGPLLKAGNTWYYFYEVNAAGCLELVGEADCAPNVQIDFLCRYDACAANCPLSSLAGFDPLMQCLSDAGAQTCAPKSDAANCLKDPEHGKLCTGPGFLGKYLAVANAFCL